MNVECERSAQKRDSQEKKRQFSGKSSSTKKEWHRPTLKDVSAEIMAQPYIRFT